MMYNYSGDFAASPESQERAATGIKQGQKLYLPVAVLLVTQ